MQKNIHSQKNDLLTIKFLPQTKIVQYSDGVIHILKYLRSITLGFKGGVGIRKSEFVVKTQFL